MAGKHVQHRRLRGSIIATIISILLAVGLLTASELDSRSARPPANSIGAR